MNDIRNCRICGKIFNYVVGPVVCPRCKEKLEENEVKCTIEVLPDYGHEWAFWDREVKSFLDWIPRTDPYYQEAPIRRI